MNNPNNLGDIRNGYPSYTGNESYDYLAVLSAGGVSSCGRYIKTDIEEKNVFYKIDGKTLYLSSESYVMYKGDVYYSNISNSTVVSYMRSNSSMIINTANVSFNSPLTGSIIVNNGNGDGFVNVTITSDYSDVVVTKENIPVVGGNAQFTFLADELNDLLSNSSDSELLINVSYGGDMFYNGVSNITSVLYV